MVKQDRKYNDYLILDKKISALTKKLVLRSFMSFTCNCQHCLEIKKQADRAERRQAELVKNIPSK